MEKHYYICWNKEWKELDFEILENKLWTALCLRTVSVFSEKMENGDQILCVCPAHRIAVPIMTVY